jgi:DNA polymerase III subunit beta
MVEVVSRTIEGSYPEYRAVVPDKSRTFATLSREALVKGVKAAALFSRTGLYDVHFAFEPSAGKLVLSATDSQVGEQEAALSAAEMKGDENRITLNYRYLLDGLNAMDAAEVKLQVIDANAPCLMTPQGPTSDYLYLVMPIKV